MTDENPPDWKCRVCKMSDDLFALDELEMCRRCYDRACSEGATKGEELPWNDDCVLCGGEVFQPETPSCSLRKIKLASLAPEPSSPAETLDLPPDTVYKPEPEPEKGQLVCYLCDCDEQDELMECDSCQEIFCSSCHIDTFGLELKDPNQPSCLCHVCGEAAKAAGATKEPEPEVDEADFPATPGSIGAERASTDRVLDMKMNQMRKGTQPLQLTQDELIEQMAEQMMQQPAPTQDELIEQMAEQMMQQPAPEPAGRIPFCTDKFRELMRSKWDEDLSELLAEKKPHQPTEDELIEQMAEQMMKM
jgi:hypothetical protein